MGALFGGYGSIRNPAIGRAGIRRTMLGGHLPDIGDALPALGPAPHAVEKSGCRTDALVERLLDLLFREPVADTDIHDLLNPTGDRTTVNAIENECQSPHKLRMDRAPDCRIGP